MNNFKIDPQIKLSKILTSNTNFHWCKRTIVVIISLTLCFYIIICNLHDLESKLEAPTLKTSLTSIAHVSFSVIVWPTFMIVNWKSRWIKCSTLTLPIYCWFQKRNKVSVNDSDQWYSAIKSDIDERLLLRIYTTRTCCPLLVSIICPWHAWPWQ